MNHLLLGSTISWIDHIDPTSNFCLIDDGPIIDALKLPSTQRSVTRFDIEKHGLQPLYRIDHIRAANIIAIFDAIFPEGTNTLTKKNANFALLMSIHRDRLRRLDRFQDDPKDPGRHEMYQKIQTLLFSPILCSVLCEAKQTALGKVVLVRLDRAKIGDFDAFVIASFIAMAYKGQVIIPDFAFYGRDFHMKLLRENRLIAGVDFLDHIKSTDLRKQLLTIPQKTLAGALYDDAELLARHAGLRPDPTRQDNPFDNFIRDAMDEGIELPLFNRAARSHSRGN